MTAVDHLTGATVGQAPHPCRGCMWWQTRPGRPAGDRDRWIRDAEDEFGPWGKVYRDETGVIGLIQYGPAQEFPRAQTGTIEVRPVRDIETVRQRVNSVAATSI